MPRIYILTAIAALLFCSTAAIAGSGEYTNLDAMGLASGKGMITECNITGQYGGKTYCFGDENSKTEFMKDPERNHAKADAFYASKVNDPNWKPCHFGYGGMNTCD
jgi:YHS domain-containing protein